MQIKDLSIRAVGFLALVAMMGACKITEPPALPVAAEMPETYIGDTDTLTDGVIRWQEFFTDPQLVTLIETALKNNFDMLTAIQRVEMARADYSIRSGALLPSVNLAGTVDLGSVNDNLVAEGAQDPSANRLTEEYFLGIQASWEADLWESFGTRRKPLTRVSSPLKKASIWSQRPWYRKSRVSTTNSSPSTMSSKSFARTSISRRSRWR